VNKDNWFKYELIQGRWCRGRIC